MIILLKLPTEKRVKNEMKPLNAQKGPTCWYYASRLVREFHQLTSHWSNEANKQVEKEISSVRKFETAIDSALDKIGNRPPNEIEMEKIKKLLDGLMPENNQIPSLEWQDMVKQFYAKGMRQGRDRLFDLLKTWNSYKKLGVSTSEGIWAKYRFTFQDSAMDPNTLSLRVWSWGPLLASGDFCADSHEGSKISLAGRAEVTLTTQFVKGGHVIVLCGVGVLEQRSVLFYHDPNDPAVCRAMYYDTYAELRNQTARLGMIACDEHNCKHVQDSRLL